MIIEAFTNKIFPLSKPHYYPEMVQKKMLCQEVVLLVIVKMSY